MTIRLDGKVSVPVGAGVELEVIEAFAGVEQHRFRAGNDVELSIPVAGSRTIILREVKTDDDLTPAPGEQRHGALDVLNPAHDGPRLAGLEEGDDEPKLTALDEADHAATSRLLAVVRQFLDTEGEAVQEQLYSELRQAARAQADASAELQAYLMGGAA